MEFRKECFVNLNIWACDRKHAKHQYCRLSDFVVQKPMRTRSISKYHFQHRYRMHALESLLSLSLSLYNLLSKFANSLDLEDLRRIAKPNQGQTGIPRIDHVSECPTLRPMPRKNIINLSRDMRFPTMWNVGPAKPQISLRIYTQSDQSLC